MSDLLLRTLERKALTGDHDAKYRLGKLREKLHSRLELAALAFVQARTDRDVLKAKRLNHECEVEDTDDPEEAPCWRLVENWDVMENRMQGRSLFEPCASCVERRRLDGAYQTAARKMGRSWTKLREAAQLF